MKITDTDRINALVWGHRRFRKAVNCRQNEDTIVETRVRPGMTVRKALDGYVLALRAGSKKRTAPKEDKR